MATLANRVTHQQNDHSYLNVILILSWAIFFLPYYLLGGLRLIMPSGTTTNWWEAFLLPIWLWVFCISFFFFTKAIVYVLISFTMLMSAMAAFMWGYKGRLGRISTLLVTLSVIALPWLLPYEPALNPAPGVTMQVVTQPQSPIESFVKMAYFFSEEVPCEYSLLGWSTENQLYYRSECGGKEQIWHVHPEHPDAAMPITALSSDMMPERSKIREEALREEVLEMVRADGVRPESAEPSVRGIYLQEGSLPSPDGQWIAIVSQHIYGPQDVVLLSQAKE